jgi:hypothetical protein
MPNYDSKMLRDGERRLEKVLNKARAAALTGKYRAEVRVPVATVVLPHVTDANLRALVVYKIAGGWVADIVFGGFPPGLPTAAGVPEAQAVATEQEAEALGFDILVGLLAAAERPFFDLFGYDMPLARETFDALRKRRPGSAKGYENISAAVERIRSLLFELMPDGFQPEAFNKLPEKERRHVMVVLHMAALTGVVAYP